MDKKRIMIIAAIVLASVGLAAAIVFTVRHFMKDGMPEIVLTEGFDEDEIFRINTKGCSIAEARVYMSTLEDNYSDAFGSEIWTKEIGNGVTLEDEIKSTVLARLAQIKAMNLLAVSRSVELDEDELAQVKKAASQYLSGLSSNSVQIEGVDSELIEKMYSEYAVANKVYLDITRNINPEISDDEARTISVKHILFNTYTVSADGSTRQFSDAEKESIYERAEAVSEKIAAGEDFDALVEKYNEDTESTYTFGKGQMPESFETAAFNLGTDEISGIVETEYGYHIIKCISTFDREETDNNKKRILLERKKEAFNKVYDEFVETLHSDLNEELWNEVEFSSDGISGAAGFFDIYNEVFTDSQ